MIAGLLNGIGNSDIAMLEQPNIYKGTSMDLDPLYYKAR